ncbi:GNAT family N-acetyltransferase [Gracilibacillus salinarum]|uniref:GNAT family N-acetyltransferase n=1 Tax=Gracilibacillus salinarum TaxID=2932255 RepID=A0ABY4GJT1_9BACI|nr:GNAT family N-acetyltransferase [Gracilibacillus salinarum]UOQ84474.1 GNAT family N-acetyltransferase [Gracilibacillus salinarum]
MINLSLQQWAYKDFIINTSKEELDIDTIHHFLSKESYWAQGIAMEDVKKSIDNTTLCFGMYQINKDTNKKRMIGFARVISDLVTFAYLTDVFIVKDFKGLGLGKWLLETITNYDELKIRRILLMTEDGHTLYDKFGFETLDKPDLFMQIKGKGAL